MLTLNSSDQFFTWTFATLNLCGIFFGFLCNRLTKLNICLNGETDLYRMRAFYISPCQGIPKQSYLFSSHDLVIMSPILRQMFLSICISSINPIKFKARNFTARRVSLDNLPHLYSLVLVADVSVLSILNA